MTATNTFDMWCIVELMGHNRIAGKVTEQVIAGSAMLRVDVPKTPSREPFTKFFNSTAVYAITPTDEATAMKAAVAFEVVPISEYILHIQSPALVEKVRDPRNENFLWGNGDLDDPDDESFFGDDDHRHDDDPDDEDEGDESAPQATPTIQYDSVWQIVRDETKNSKSPMWRCSDHMDRRFNVFKHSDAEKDTFHLFTEAGYGDVMLAMKLGDVMSWRAHPIRVDLQRTGDWLNVVRVYPRPEGSMPDAQQASPKAKAAEWAKKLLDDDFVVLDVETTGLNTAFDEPVSISIVGKDGTVLLDTLVQASQPVNPEAAAIHGITDEKVKDAPTLNQLEDKMVTAMKDKRVIVYNVEFDTKMIDNALNPFNEDTISKKSYLDFGAKGWECAMYQYSLFYGEPYWKGGYKSQSLKNALEQQGIENIGTLHSAIGDCQATLALIKKMAEYEEVKSDAHPF